MHRFAITALMMWAAIGSAIAWGEILLPRAVMERHHREFMKTHCTQCHNADESNGGVRLDDLPLEIADVATADRWAKVLAVLNSGEMPPEGEPRPDNAAKTAFLEALSKQMVVARKALSDTAGAVAMRRLNRREYVNTIQELLDVEVNPRDLPSDDDSGSFDTVGSNLFFSEGQFEQYLALARTALDQAIVLGRRPETRVRRIEPEIAVNEAYGKRFATAIELRQRVDAWRLSGGKSAVEFGFLDDGVAGRAGMLLETEFPRLRSYTSDPLAKTGALPQKSSFHPQALNHGGLEPGRYMVRVRLGFDASVASAERVVEIGCEEKDVDWPAGMKLLGWRAIKGTPESPEVIEFPIVITKGGSRGFAIREKRPSGIAAASYESERRRRVTRQDDFLRTLWIDWIEWEGPIVDQWPPRSLSLALGGVDVGSAPGEDEARRVITSFAERAFRGQPVDPSYVNRLVAHFARETRAKKPFHEAIKTPLSIVLASPSFLYLAEPAEAGEQSVEKATGRQRLTGVELANRLAYFLWAGPPDDRLLSLAADGRLEEPAMLAGEVDRMLAHERSNRFISGFTHQWLHMVRLDFFQFNVALYPRYDGTIKEAARQEVYETLKVVLAENLPLSTLLQSDFVVINQVLADYYGLTGVEGQAFRRVPVPDGVPRGGLLGMAAILAMGSDGTRTSAVERGAWVLRSLLHDPPPPAPANVPQLARFSGQLMPARALMMAHQEQPQCAHCHRKIDPLGYGLEHFDAAGAWRDVEKTVEMKLGKVSKSQEFAIDTTGTLPDGTPFDGFFELRAAVANHKEAFARGLVEHLIEYAIGRPCSFTDEELIASILHESADVGYTPRALIQALVASDAFRSK